MTLYDKTSDTDECWNESDIGGEQDEDGCFHQATYFEDVDKCSLVYYSTRRCENHQHLAGG